MQLPARQLADFYTERSADEEQRGSVRICPIWWELVDSNHRSIKQQIYSLSPLATRESSHIMPSSRVLDYYSKRLPKMQAFFEIFYRFFHQLYQSISFVAASSFCSLTATPAIGVF